MTYACTYHAMVIQWNLSRPNFCIRNRRFIQIILTQISHVGTLYKVWLIQYSVLFRVQTNPLHCSYIINGSQLNSQNYSKSDSASSHLAHQMFITHTTINGSDDNNWTRWANKSGIREAQLVPIENQTIWQKLVGQNEQNVYSVNLQNSISVKSLSLQVQ